MTVRPLMVTWERQTPFLLQTGLYRRIKLLLKPYRITKNQADAQGLVEKLNSLHTPIVEEKAFYTFDNGKNVAFGNQISSSLRFLQNSELRFHISSGIQKIRFLRIKHFTCCISWGRVQSVSPKQI